MSDIVKRLGDEKRQLRERMRTCTLKEALLLQDEIDRINGEIDRVLQGDLPGQLTLF